MKLTWWLSLFFSIWDFKLVVCDCEKSFFIVCESLNDVRKTGIQSGWTNLMIQPKKIDEISPNIVFTKNTFGGGYSYQLISLFIINQLTGIEARAFKHHVYKLQNLVLYKNNIRTVKKRTFTDFKKMTLLSLDNNKIENLEKEAFYFSNIETVDLSYNKIATLKSEIFKSCPLKQLIVTHNVLRTMEINSLPKSIEILRLDYNKIIYLPEELNNLENLKELSISHNSLLDLLNLGSLPSLRRLDLSFNKIESVNDQFNNSYLLKYLDLTGNSLTRLDSGYLKNITTRAGIFMLFLGHNHFSNLHLEQFIGITKTYVTLSGNPWNCQCFEQMQKFIVNSTKIEEVKCQEEEEHLGKRPYCIPRQSYFERCSEAEITQEYLFYLTNFKKLAKAKSCHIPLNKLSLELIL